MVKISLIICTYNREKYLPDAIESLINQKEINPGEIEIVIIDNNSTDNTEVICNGLIARSNDTPIYYFKEHKQGLSHARNRGIEVSNGLLLAFLDDDAFAHEKYVRHTLDFFGQNTGVTAAGGVILLHFENKEPAWYSHYIGSLLGYFCPWENSRAFDKKQYPRGSNMIFRRELFRKYGFFNPELGRKGEGMLGSEEKEMFGRIYSGNENVWYFPQAVIYHIIPDSRLSRQFIRKQSVAVGKSERIRVGKNRNEKLKKFYEESLKWMYSVILFLFYLTTIRPSKGVFLLQFRYWVFLGLRGKE